MTKKQEARVVVASWTAGARLYWDWGLRLGKAHLADSVGSWDTKRGALSAARRAQRAMATAVIEVEGE